LQWDALISANKEDLAKILVYETGKPFLEAIAEIDYALTFTWWFAGEAERIFGTVQTSAAPGRRVFTIKQPVGVTAALVPWNFPVCEFWVPRFLPISFHLSNLEARVTRT
jgi:succinate-semialdehyde dehydrogenase/glutarate-semialdehyde dehydrogenase